MLCVFDHNIARDIVARMSSAVPNARCELNFDSPYQLLVAVVLSAQCTDVRVNQVTKVLFERASTPQDMLHLDRSQLEDILRPIGFFRNKARSLINMSQMLIDDYDSVVPSTRQELTQLAGVGRKTANVILMECFGQPVIAVDTHVYRVSKRLGLSNAETPELVERDLYVSLPRDLHIKAHQTILHFGRYFCTAQRPKCKNCVVRHHCAHIKESE